MHRPQLSALVRGSYPRNRELRTHIHYGVYPRRCSFASSLIPLPRNVVSAEGEAFPRKSKNTREYNDFENLCAALTLRGKIDLSSALVGAYRMNSSCDLHICSAVDRVLQSRADLAECSLVRVCLPLENNNVRRGIPRRARRA